MLTNIHILIAKTIREDNIFSIVIVVYNTLINGNEKCIKNAHLKFHSFV